MDKLPPWFKYKVAVDRVVLTERRKPVVDLLVYRKLREQQARAFLECEKAYFPKKSGDK